MHNVPELEIDKLIHPSGVPARLKVERRIVFALLNHLQAAGFKIDGVFDGDDETATNDNILETMELVFNLDEVIIYFKNKQGHYHTVLLNMGEGTEMICDWSFFGDGDSDGFGAAMDAFNTEDYA